MMDEDDFGECVEISDGDDLDIEGDEESFDGEEIEFGPSRRLEECKSLNYVVLSQDEIAESMVQSIKEVNDIFQIHPLGARALLMHFRWDKERLLERYYDGDPEKLLAEAHVTVTTSKVTVGASTAHVSRSPTCEICFLDVAPSDICHLHCGHGFCNSCWRSYLTDQIMDLGVSQHISCAGYKCGALMDQLTVSKLLTSPEVKKKYNYLMAKNFVEANRLFQWCPAAGCTNAVKCNECQAYPVTCKCGHIFCFKCSEPAHEPVLCKYLSLWMKKCADDSETSHWMSANTKECPQCKAVIEKSGGCNHMMCRNQACKFEFCWVCAGSWGPHGSSWYNCNKFDAKKAEEDRTSADSSRTALRRYLFFCDRYLNHCRSRKLESKLHDKVKVKAEELQANGLTWIEAQFLSVAVDVLMQCRAVLMNTYVFAYYLKSNNQAEIFLANQKDFEMSTEALSYYLERDVSGTDAGQMKSACQDKMEYCRSRCQKLVDHVNEGYDKDWWVYTD